MGPVTTNPWLIAVYQYDHSFWCIGYALGVLDENHPLGRSYSSKKN